MLKVLYCAHSDNYHIKTWSSVLHKHGVEIEYFTLRPDPVCPFPQHVPPGFGLTTSSIRYHHFIESSPRLHRVFDQGNFDLVFASFANTYGLTASLADIRPRVIQTWSRDIGADRSVTPRESIMNQTIGRRVLSKADAITTDGPHFKNHLLNRYPQLANKTLSTAWGIDTHAFKQIDDIDVKSVKSRWNIDSNATVITSIRGVFWYYQPELILSSFLQLLNQRTDIHLMIPTLGHQPAAHVDTLLQKLGKHPNVTVFPDLISFQEMLNLWAVTDVYISLPRFDGVAESVQEGMYAGAIPVLNPLEANKVITDQLSNDGIVWTTGSEPDRKELLRCIDQAIQLTKDSNFRKIKQRHRSYIEKNWSVHTTADNLINLFKRLI